MSNGHVALLQAVTFLKIKPEIEGGCLEESDSAEKQRRALVERGVKEEPGEIEGRACEAAVVCC